MASINDAFGARLQLDIDDFLSGVTTAKQALAELRREFRNEVAGLDNWRKSIDGVTARINMLNASIEIEQKYQEKLEEQIEDLANSEEDHSESLKKKQKDLENSRAEVERYNKEIRNLDKTLEGLRAEEAKNNTALSKLSRTINEQENELAELIFSYHNAILTFGKSSDEARDFERRIKSLNDELRENRNVMNEVTGVDPTKGFSFGTLFSGTMLGNVAGNGVLRRSNVRSRACFNVMKSKSKHSVRSQMSKKSFRRLFFIPSVTIASNFSAMTVYRGYTLIRGFSASSRTGYSVNSAAGKTESPKPISNCKVTLAWSIRA